MDERFLGRTGVRISRLAFGTMSFGGDADEAESARLFAACRDAGVTCFDCADVYAGGRSEELLGRFLEGCRNEVVLTTKAFFPSGEGGNDRGSSRYHLVRAVEASLARLRTDRIDVYFLHGWDGETALEETLGALESLVRQGKILYPAVSNFAAWQAMKALGIARCRGWQPIVCVQPMYNLVKRQAEVEILPFCRSEGLGCLPYSPLGGGLLAGRYGVDRRPDAGRLVANEMYAARYGEASYFEAAEELRRLAVAWGHHPATVAVAWVASRPGVTAPLLGARSVEQLAPSLAAASVELTEAQLAAVTALFPAPPPATDRSEEQVGLRYGSR